LREWNDMPKAAQLVIKHRIHIFSNGELAETKYFQEFKDDLRSHAITVYKLFKHLSPWELIDKVVAKKTELMGKRKFSEEDNDQCWCVFDVDNYWKDNPKKFAEVLKVARQNGVRLAWSNECFELWYLLHFQELQTGIPRKDYDTKLKKHFQSLDGKNYVKNCSVFTRLKGKQASAIKNAKQIFQEGKVEENPSTAVFQLVEELNNYDR